MKQNKIIIIVLIFCYEQLDNDVYLQDVLKSKWPGADFNTIKKIEEVLKL